MEKKITLELTQKQFDMIQSLLCQEGRSARLYRENKPRYDFVTALLFNLAEAEEATIERAAK